MVEFNNKTNLSSKDTKYLFDNYLEIYIDLKPSQPLHDIFIFWSCYNILYRIWIYSTTCLASLYAPIDEMKYERENKNQNVESKNQNILKEQLGSRVQRPLLAAQQILSLVGRASSYPDIYDRHALSILSLIPMDSKDILSNVYFQENTDRKCQGYKLQQWN